MGKQNLITIQLLAISGILISILVSMVAFRQFALPESKADLSTEVVVTPPYLRIAKQKSEVIDGKKIVTAEVLANTNGMSVLGADVVMEYDPEVLQPKEDGVQSTGAFAVLNVNKQEEGVLDFSVFSSPDRNEPLLTTNADQETPIATVQFVVKNESIAITQIQIQFMEGKLDDSNLILHKEPRTETPTDILHSVQSAILTL